MSRRSELVLCTSTLQTDPMVCTAADFLDQLDAAAAAGFAGISQWELHYSAITAEGMTHDQFAAAFSERDLAVAALEAVLPFVGELDDVLVSARGSFELANRLGAGIVPVISLFPGEFDSVEAAIERYGVVCDLATEHDIKVPIEFLPWSGIPDLATAWQIVDATDRPSGGIMIDTWHWIRQPGGPNTELLAEIPPSFLPLVQLCDATPVASDDLYHEAMASRLAPGAGSVDFDEFLTALYATGADPVMAVEVFNSDLAGGGRHEMAATLASTTATVLADYL